MASPTTAWGILRGPSANEGGEEKLVFPKEFTSIPSATIKAPQRNWDLLFTGNMDPALNPLRTSVRDFFQILKGGLNRSLNLNYLSVQSSALSWKLELITLLVFLYSFWFVIAVTREHADGITAALPTSGHSLFTHLPCLHGKAGDRHHHLLPTSPIPSFLQSSGPGFFAMRLCKIFIALSTKFCLWPSFLLSRELLHQCLGFFLHPYKKKKGIESFVYKGFASYFSCLLPSWGPWLYNVGGKKKPIFFGCGMNIKPWF